MIFSEQINTIVKTLLVRIKERRQKIIELRSEREDVISDLTVIKGLKWNTRNHCMGIQFCMQKNAKQNEIFLMEIYLTYKRQHCRKYI